MGFQNTAGLRRCFQRVLSFPCWILLSSFLVVGAQPADWCGGHGVPESKCTLCNPELISRFKAEGDWCEEHGLPESVCPKCTGQAVLADWCGGHGVPESKCTLCNPELIPKFKKAGDWCEEHGFPESVCTICNPQVLTAEAIELRLVRFNSPDLEARAGIQTELVRKGDLASGITCSAQIDFHGDRTADLRAVIPGIVRQIHVSAGDWVETGDPLFELESAQIAETQAHLKASRERVRLAESNLQRQQILKKQDIATEWELETARRELETARAEARSAVSVLRMAGASDLEDMGRLIIRAPIEGTLVRRPAVVGALATEDTSLGMIADTRLMWVVCQVPENDAGILDIDASMEVVAASGETWPGKLTWISSEVDPRSRTIAARAEVSNPRGRLRANQFVQAYIQASSLSGAMLVPRSALQRVGDLYVVFVRLEPGLYQPRVVQSKGDGDMVLVDGRLLPGEEVVTTGAVLLKTEVLPGSIGAGCCEIETPEKGRR